MAELAGDALITRAWSEVGDVAFLGLIDAIRAATCRLLIATKMTSAFDPQRT